MKPVIRYVENSNLFDSNADALINPVNCKGTMGKGIAREFSKRFPECVPPYKQACITGKLTPGVLLYVKLAIQPDFFAMRRPGIILFPTKNHWKDPSRLEWIDQGLHYLKSNYQLWGIRSVAMPQVGCGLGGLNWELVRPIVEEVFSGEPIEIEVYLSAVPG